MLLKKDDVNDKKSNFARRGGDFRSASVLFVGNDLPPLNHVANHTYSSEQNSPLFLLFREREGTYFQCEEVMSHNNHLFACFPTR